MLAVVQQKSTMKNFNKVLETENRMSRRTRGDMIEKGELTKRRWRD